MTEAISIAVIGGSGLYHMPELTDIQEQTIDTPFGKPSDAITIGTLRGQRVAFLPRHGRGHVLTPSEVPYRANIYALKTLGITHIISVSACGSLREDYAPGQIVIPDQIYDNTKSERGGRSFFGDGIVAHVGVADPFCPELSVVLAEATTQAGGAVHRGGTFVTIEGPRFSTKGESQVYRQLGFSIIGMTAAPEAFLAREAELCYATIAHVTDYDVWHTDETVSADLVFKRFQNNVRIAQQTIAQAVERIARLPRVCGCKSALANSFATARERVRPEIKTRLRPIIGPYFPG
ncbi:MAG: S-methyl-5'-thioadenosine phosphorylase [Aggregatilineales bacterium]